MDVAPSIRIVLAAVGQLPQDEAVLARAIELAGAHRAALTVAHFVDLPEWTPLIGDAALIRQRLDRDARDRMADLLGRHGAGAAEASVVIEDGPPSQRIVELSEDLGADLIVMRAHERASIAEKIVGSTTDRVIRASTAPVLVVKRPVTHPYRNVLIATDGSDDEPGASAYAATLVPEARLRLIQVVEIPPPLEEALLRVGIEQTALSAQRDALARGAKDRLLPLAADLARRHDARVTTRVLSGDPAGRLVQATRAPNVDLIALGPGRPGLLRHAFLGSVTWRILRDAACDVLVVRSAPGGC